VKFPDHAARCDAGGEAHRGTELRAVARDHGHGPRLAHMDQLAPLKPNSKSGHRYRKQQKPEETNQRDFGGNTGGVSKHFTNIPSEKTGHRIY